MKTLYCYYWNLTLSFFQEYKTRLKNENLTVMFLRANYWVYTMRDARCYRFLNYGITVSKKDLYFMIFIYYNFKV